MISIKNLTKSYPNGFTALKNVNLEIKEGEIFALLGPNGAGKTTLISAICGITQPTTGSVSVNGHDIIKDFRKTRSLIGLVPQELTTDAFETVSNTVHFSRGLFGKKRDDALVEKILNDLTLLDKKDNQLMTLSGGMKRRVMIAKALSHEPRVLFLDEPTAGVDVELRKDMWKQVKRLQNQGVTIILTTHYIEEAEEMADRIGIINKGEIVLVDETKNLMKNFGTKQLTVNFSEPLSALPSQFKNNAIKLEENSLTYTYDSRDPNNGVAALLNEISGQNLKVQDINTKQSSLEEIFVDLVKEK